MSIATTGLGMRSVKALAKHNPAHIYLSGRNVKRGEAVVEETKKASPEAALTFIQCDLSSFESIEASIQKFNHDRLDILMCSAGIMAVGPELSKDGYEIQWATNHLGHALLIKKLLPTMLKTAEKPGSDVRILFLSSVAWSLSPSGGIQFSRLKTTQDFIFLGPWRRYGQSKLANIVYAAELARRYPSITSVSLHPGVVKTDLVGNLSFGDKAFVYIGNLGNVVTPEEGVLNQLWAAAGAKKERLDSGAYYMPIGIQSNSKLNKTGKDPKFAAKLWEWTETELEGH